MLNGVRSCRAARIKGANAMPRSLNIEPAEGPQEHTFQLLTWHTLKLPILHFLPGHLTLPQWSP